MVGSVHDFIGSSGLYGPPASLLASGCKRIAPESASRACHLRDEYATATFQRLTQCCVPQCVTFSAMIAWRRKVSRPTRSAGPTQENQPRSTHGTTRAGTDAQRCNGGRCRPVRVCFCWVADAKAEEGQSAL